MSLILYAEDDALLQADGELALQSAGYEVVLAADGEDACSALRRLGTRLSLLMTDICLGGPVDGWQVAELGRTINARLPVLYMTGTDGADFARRAVAQGVMFGKPFGWPQVLRAVELLS